MNVLRHAVASFVIFALFAGLYLQVYDDFQEGYGFTSGDEKDLLGHTSGNIVEQFRSMNLISGIATLQEGILDLSSPSSAQFDLLGGLALVGIGAIKTIAGLVTTPVELIGIVIEFYTAIPAIVTELAVIVIVYVGFILLSAAVQRDI